MKSAAVYARISTQEGQQHLDNQVAAGWEFIARQNGPRGEWGGESRWEPAPKYVWTDQDSGGRNDRPGLAAMFRAAAAHRFDALIVFDLSRFTREGPARAFEYIQRLTRYGVEFWSINEPHFRTGGIAGDLLIAIAAYFAAEERRAIRARVQAGLNRAREQGKKLGRPQTAVNPVDLARLRGAGLSVAQIARALDCSPSTIERRLRTHAGNRPEAL